MDKSFKFHVIGVLACLASTKLLFAAGFTGAEANLHGSKTAQTGPLEANSDRTQGDAIGTFPNKAIQLVNVNSNNFYIRLFVKDSYGAEIYFDLPAGSAIPTLEEFPQTTVRVEVLPVK